MVIRQGDVCWADLPTPTGSEPGFRRPVVVIQGDPLNRSNLATTVVVALTSTMRLADAPGNVKLPARATGLPKDSVANVSAITTIDKSHLTETTGHLSKPKLGLILSGIDLVLDRG